MPHRHRRQRRLELLLSVREHSKAQGWDLKAATEEFRRRALVELDVTAASLPTAVSEFRLVYDPRLDHFIDRLQRVAEHTIEQASVGTKLRLYHLFIGHCNAALAESDKDVGTVVREIERRTFRKNTVRA